MTTDGEKLQKRKKILFFLFMIGLASLIGLLISEIGLRIFFPQQESVEFVRCSCLQVNPVQIVKIKDLRRPRS
jgi:hypothetical protein